MALWTPPIALNHVFDLATLACRGVAGFGRHAPTGMGARCAFLVDKTVAWTFHWCSDWTISYLH